MEQENKCVYVHKLNGEVVYVGSGALGRYKSKNDRSEKHLVDWSKLEFHVVSSGLSLVEAFSLEQELIIKYDPVFNIIKRVSIPNAINWVILSEYFEYSVESKSKLRWLKPTSKCHRLRQDMEAGGLQDKGYYVVRFLGKLLRVSRVIYAIVNKKDIPNNLVIDHIDGNPSNNLSENLRLATYSQNNFNQPTRSDNKTGEKNIAERLYQKCFMVSYRMNGKIISKLFNYHQPSVNNYHSRESALCAAKIYRDSLIESGLLTKAR